MKSRFGWLCVVGSTMGVLALVGCGDPGGGGTGDGGMDAMTGNDAGTMTMTQFCASQVDGTSCDDGNTCTTGETCQAGVCVPPTLTCDDGHACTTGDECQPDGTCQGALACTEIDGVTPYWGQNGHSTPRYWDSDAGQGDAYYYLKCAPGSLLAGIAGNPEQYSVNTSLTVIGRLRPICAYPMTTLADDGIGYSVAWDPSSFVGTAPYSSVGTSPTTEATLMCPAGEFIVGIDWKGGTVTDSIGISCAPIEVREAADRYFLRTGAETAVAGRIGGTGGNTAAVMTCSADSVGHQILVNLDGASSAIQGMYMMCSQIYPTEPITTVYNNGIPFLVGGTGFLDDCPPGYVVASIGAYLASAGGEVRRANMRCVKLRKISGLTDEIAVTGPDVHTPYRGSASGSTYQADWCGYTDNSYRSYRTANYVTERIVSGAGVPERTTGLRLGCGEIHLTGSQVNSYTPTGTTVWIGSTTGGTTADSVAGAFLMGHQGSINTSGYYKFFGGLPGHGQY